MTEQTFDHIPPIGHLRGLTVSNWVGNPVLSVRDLSDHELRWALRDSIQTMYRHLGLLPQQEEE